MRKGATPWYISFAATSFITAFHLDNTPRENLRWIEGGSTALALALIVAVVSVFLIPIFDPASADQAPWYVAAAMGAAMGFLIGFYIPTWYRESPYLDNSPDEENGEEAPFVMLHQY